MFTNFLKNGKISSNNSGSNEAPPITKKFNKSISDTNINVSPNQVILNLFSFGNAIRS